MRTRSRHTCLVLPLCLALLNLYPGALSAQHARDIDPMIGADGGGNTFPGALVPFGLLKAGPDMSPNTGNGGWLPNQPITGFSQTHISGTGGGAKYGNILLQPTTGPVLPDDHASPASGEHASAGYYGVQLGRYGIHVEIAPARRSALYRMTYPSSEQANLLIDASHCLSSYANQNEDQRIVASSVKILSPSKIEGASTVTGGWNQQTTNYTVYFFAETDTPAVKSGTWTGQTIHADKMNASAGPGGSSGAWLSFHTHAGQTVRIKIGISFISAEQAQSNAENELPGFDFDALHRAAEQAWDKALAPLQVQGASEDESRQFATALYHAMFQPTDFTGENWLFKTSEPSYDDYYAIWDTFRTSNPLLTLIAQDRASGMVRSLIDIYRHEGWMPDGRSAGFSGRMQGGSNADMVIVDGFLKHLPGVDWQQAYAAVLADAEKTPPNPILAGRGGLDAWRTQGYLAIEDSDRPASKTVEYAANDYAIALFAKGMGKLDDYHKYRTRASNWRKLWDPDACDHGFCGFIWPRHRDGSWKPNFDPLLTGTWGSDSYYEGNPWTYSIYVPQDTAGLVAASGGSARFVERMDAFFSLPGRYDVGNEPGFLAPYLYLWAGRPDRTQFQIRRILAANYHSGPSGLPGNDDSGAMSSWYVFGKLGIYPSAAQDLYLIGSPAFRRASIHLPNGRTFTIEAVHNSTGHPYIASASWNGKPLTRAWFTHEQLMKGGTLRLMMSATPSTWGSKDLPPSLSSSEDPRR